MTPRYNLRCPHGHRFYSPDPEAWAGRDCGFTRKSQVTTTMAQRVRITRCRQPLGVISR